MSLATKTCCVRETRSKVFVAEEKDCCWRRKLTVCGKHVSKICVAEEMNFCRWRRKLAVCGKHASKYLLLRKNIVAGDENLLCAGNTYQRLVSLTTIFNAKHAMIEDKIFVACDRNRAVCARL